VPGATATSLLDAVRAEHFAGELDRFKTTAAFARGVFVRFLVHALAKLSANATALRMDIDLFTVS